MIVYWDISIVKGRILIIYGVLLEESKWIRGLKDE